MSLRRLGPRRRRTPTMMLMFAVLVALLMLGNGDESHAQQSTVVVENTAQSGGVRIQWPETNWRVTKFTTANVRHQLDRVRVTLSSDDSAQVGMVILHDNAGKPGSTYARMSGDAGTLGARQFANYTPDGTTYLEPFTTYWVAVSAFGGTAKIRVADINDDQDGLRHWTIGDDTRDRDGNFVSTHSISMTVFATSAPADKLAVSNRARGEQSSNLAEARVIGTSFTTGSTKYVLNKVRLLMTRESGAWVGVSIRNNASGNTIGTTIEALTANGTVSTGDIAQIDYSSDGLFLAANTTYWVVVGIAGGNGKVELATSDSEDPEAATGWSLGNHTEDINSDDDYSANSLKMQVFADETEELDSVVVVSQPLDGDTYKGGENLEIEYRFTAEVVHVSGTARLNLGDQARRAEYISGSGTNTLLYSYVVQSTDVDTENGFNIGANSLGSSGSSNIRTAANNRPLILTHSSQDAGNSHKVDGRTVGCFRFWCADLEAATAGGPQILGFRDPGPGETLQGSLSNRVVRRSGSAYVVDQLTVRDGNQLKLVLDRQPDPGLLQNTRLRVGTQDFRLSDGTFDAAGNSVTWSNSSLSLSSGSTVRVAIDMLPVSLQFGSDSHTVGEGDDVGITVSLGGPLPDSVEIPIAATNQDGASDQDYSLTSDTLTVAAGDTEATVDFTALQDDLDDDGEKVVLAFGSDLSDRLLVGATGETTVNIADDDHPHVTVQFPQSDYTVAEGDTVNVTVRLSAAPEREVTIPITATGQDGATSADYTVPTSVPFAADETEKTITFEAEDDDADDDDESVKLGFGTSLPERITPGTANETTLTIGDDDHPTVTVSFAQAAYTAAEGATQQVSVSVSADPERTIIIPITATPQGTASAADYTVMPSVTFNDGDTGSKTFTIEVTQDLIDDDNEKVTLGFGTMPDPRVSAGTQGDTTVSITDDDTADILFSPTSLTVEEEDSVGYTVALATEPTVNVSVTITGHTGTDLELVSNRLTNDVLTFTSLNWNMPQTVTVETAHDDDGVADSETLAHMAVGAEYDGVDADLTVTVNDNDPLGIILQPLELTVPESGTADYGVKLATEPTAAVALNITGHSGTDLTLTGSSLLNDTLNFSAANWNTLQTLTVAAAHDGNREDDLETLSHNASGGEYEAMMEALPVTVDDNTGDLRLVDGPPIADDEEPCEGRLEIYYKGEWGTICDDFWSTEDADTACRALGFPDGSVNSGRFGSGIFPPGDRDQPIWLDDLSCDGGESHLLDCRSSPVGKHNCQHAEDVGLRCLKTTGPWIVNAEFSQPDGEDGRYAADDTVTVTLVWSEAVTVDTNPSGFPRVALFYGGQASLLYHPTGSGTERMVFTHTLGQVDGEISFDQIRLSRDSLALRDPSNSLAPSGSISSVATGDAAILGHRTYRSNEEGTMPSTSEGHAEATGIIGAPTFGEPGADGVFGAGETVEVTFTFSQAVNVDTSGGTPSVPVLLGMTAARSAHYLRGSGTDQLVFDYTLVATDGEHSSLLINPNSLVPNGGTIRNAAGHVADTAHQGAGVQWTPPSDDIAPQLQLATVNGGTLELTYSETLDSSATLLFSAFTVSVNSAPHTVLGGGIGGSQVLLMLSPPVEARDIVTVDYTASTGEGVGRVQDAAGNAATSFSRQVVTNNTPDTTAPALEAATVNGASLALAYNEDLDTDSTPAQSAYSVTVGSNSVASPSTVVINGSTVNLTLVSTATSDDTVTVSYTAPSSNPVQDAASNVAASFTDQTVTNQTGDGSAGNSSRDEGSSEGDVPEAPTHLQVVPHSSGKLSATWTAPAAGTAPTGYTIQWKSASNDWDPTEDVSQADATKTSYVIDGLMDGVEYTVRVVATNDSGDGEPSGEVTATPRETTPPSVTSASVDGAELTITFNETLQENAAPGTSAFYVTAAGSNRAVEMVTLSGAAASLTLATPVIAGNVVTVDYTAPTDESATRLQDLAGNAAASFANQSVTNNTPAMLTATTHEVPTSHDGSQTFTFELWFGEHVALSYATLRDHAFTVTGGDVVKANRLVSNDNQRWTVHVAPNGNATATLTLPATTDCEAQGAICTADGRKLSGDLTVSVPRRNDAPTGAPAIQGNARVGQILTADTSSISDGNGINNDTFTYQWLTNDGSSDTAITGATGRSYTLAEADAGNTIKVRVSFTDNAGNDETLNSGATATVVAATPLTATEHEVPESHDGTTFTFELRFSEQIPINYVTLRDHAFTVTAGEVVKARRLEPNSAMNNVRWEISITPDGNDAVTIVLPPTTDCQDEGAICASDGRKLTEQLEITVPGLNN